MEDQDIEIPLENPIIEIEQEFKYDEDSPNLVIDFQLHPDGIKALRKIADKVDSDFKMAWDSTEEYRQRIADDYKLFTGDLPPKDWPHKNAANAHVPIMLENSTRLINRIASELFGDWSATHGVVPIGPGDEPVADILTKHGNWQIRNQITDFRRQMMRGLTLYIVNGGSVCYSRYDSARKRNQHEILSPDEFVIPYTMVSTEPNMSDLPYKMRVLRYYRHELQKMRGIWENIDEVIKRSPPPWEEEPDSPLRQSAGDVTHVDPEEGDKYAPYKLIQYEGWMADLPNQRDDRYVQVIMDHSSKNILHFCIHEEEDWQDRMRYDGQMSELMSYRTGKEQYDSVINDMQKANDEAVATMSSATAGDMERAQAGAALDQLRTMPMPQAPMPPAWMENPGDPNELPKEPKRVPIHMYAHAVCIEPLVGAYGLSYGRILSDLNRAANVMMSQFIDAATLANCWGGLVSDDFDTGGKLEIAPGKLNKIKGMSGDDIRKAFIELKPGPANPQLVDLIKMCIELAQNAVQAPDVLSGAEGKSGETYRGHSARIEQATLQLGVIARGYAHFFEQVLKNNAKLNSFYLPEEEIVNIAAQPGTGVDPLTVRRDMYVRNYQVEIRSDLRFTSMTQRVAEADEIVALASNNMMLATNASLMYQAVKRSFIARQKQDLIPYLGPQPPPPAMPMAPPMPPAPEGEQPQ